KGAAWFDRLPWPQSSIGRLRTATRTIESRRPAVRANRLASFHQLAILRRRASPRARPCWDMRLPRAIRGQAHPALPAATAAFPTVSVVPRRAADSLALPIGVGARLLADDMQSTPGKFAPTAARAPDRFSSSLPRARFALADQARRLAG